ncbi:MAG: DUF192 domain-containing protein [Anaerolineaceae bacterium]|nr:DUF192 domain-containing protein [Anaerolineaceae bacterium]
MRRLEILNETHPLSEPLRVDYCDSFLDRLKGLMFRTELSEHEGIVLVETSESRLNSSIHMFFMKFDIATIWVNTKGIVVDIKLARKWRPYYSPAAPARFTIEARTEYLSLFKIGDQLAFHDV